ncbi:MAG TPA: hypothetical protein VGS05_05705 [Candidatus Sulfotelmatobacter sp.]|nr:hypothetical protein [Candidatus Sulfotelmatobacter sp.]
MAEGRHPGITMHKLPVGGGFIGILFAVGTSLIFVLGFPTLWYFVALAFALGIVIAFALRAVNQNRSERNKPLSILHTEPTKQSPAKPAPSSNLRHSAPLTAGA